MFGAFQYRRMAAIMGMVLVGLGWLGWRLYHIQVLRHQEFKTKAEDFTRLVRTLPAWRGEIRDRNGEILAVSAPTKTVYINLTLCSNRVEQVARACGPLLQLEPGQVADYLQRCLRTPGKGRADPPKAVVLRRDLPLLEWEKVQHVLESENFGLCKTNLALTEKAELRNLRRRLLFAHDEQKRRYPFGRSLGNVLGFAAPRTSGVGLAGMCGVEAALDKVLAGADGKCVSQQDAAGNELPFRRTEYTPPVDGSRVVLTIDLRVQRIVEAVVEAAQCKCQARSVSVMVMDPQTGELLAVACAPGQEASRNPGFNDMVEPGSTFKLVTLAAALDLGVRTLDSQIFCENGYCVINKTPIRDHVPHGWLSLRQCFAKSSNIGFSKVALELGPERFYRYITNFGFGRCTGVPLGETPGRIPVPAKWSTMTLTRAAFGQGISVSQLQMASAMAAIANQGRLMRPRLVSRIETPQGTLLWQSRPQFVRTVVSPRTAQAVTEALKGVVQPGGTGTAAAMARYSVAAKTGTAEKSNQQGYLKDCYYSSMIGFFPAEEPAVVIAVAVDEPQGEHFGGSVAGPIFRTIAEQVADCLAVPFGPAVAGTSTGSTGARSAMPSKLAGSVSVLAVSIPTGNSR